MQNHSLDVNQTWLDCAWQREKIFLSLRCSKRLISCDDVNKTHNCSGPPAFKSQIVGYQPNQKSLHRYQHSKN